MLLIISPVFSQENTVQYSNLKFVIVIDGRVVDDNDIKNVRIDIGFPSGTSESVLTTYKVGTLKLNLTSLNKIINKEEGGQLRLTFDYNTRESNPNAVSSYSSMKTYSIDYEANWLLKMEYNFIYVYNMDNPKYSGKEYKSLAQGKDYLYEISFGQGPLSGNKFLDLSGSK